MRSIPGRQWAVAILLAGGLSIPAEAEVARFRFIGSLEGWSAGGVIAPTGTPPCNGYLAFGDNFPGGGGSSRCIDLPPTAIATFVTDFALDDGSTVSVDVYASGQPCPGGGASLDSDHFEQNDGFGSVRLVSTTSGVPIRSLLVSLQVLTTDFLPYGGYFSNVAAASGDLIFGDGVEEGASCWWSAENP